MADQRDSVRPLHVVVIVLGDVGRSPRMQYHSLSLLDEGHFVSLVGYEGEDLVPGLQSYESNHQLNVVRFSVPAPKLVQIVKPLYFIWRIVSLALWLLWALLVSVPTEHPLDCVLVQNPPALPLLAIAYLYAWIKSLLQKGKTKPGVVIDWHNLGYSMLNPGSFQRLAKAYEKAMAPYAAGHLTVTHAMKDFLIEGMGLADLRDDDMRLRVLHDCPPSMFQPRSVQEQHEILIKLDAQLRAACPAAWYAGLDPSRQTLLTERVESSKSSTNKINIRPRSGRPALITSSTSWTSDEDFFILLEALTLLEERIAREKIHLRVLVVVTGKGPQKEFFIEKISRLTWQHVAIQTLWLDPGDYPRLLACADLGVSLHTSTSGVDLPMKILDLFGCQVPVCAFDFMCISELVKDNVNGRVFKTSSELSMDLWELLLPLTEHSDAGCHSFGVLADYSKCLSTQRRWDENWVLNALPVIRNAASKR